MSIGIWSSCDSSRMQFKHTPFHSAICMHKQHPRPARVTYLSYRTEIHDIRLYSLVWSLLSCQWIAWFINKNKTVDRNDNMHMFMYTNGQIRYFVLRVSMPVSQPWFRSTTLGVPKGIVHQRNKNLNAAKKILNSPRNIVRTFVWQLW